MAGFGIIAKLGVDATAMKKGISEAGDDVDKFGTRIGGAIKAAAVAAGAAIIAMTVKGTKDFMDFEKNITEVFTLLPEASREMKDKLQGDLRELAVTMGLDLTDATKALYSAISAGIPEDNAIAFLEQSAKLGIAGAASLEDATAALTTVINGYGMSAKDAEHVSDILFTTVKRGVTNMTELSANIGKVTPIAASLGVKFEEVGAMFATMTKSMGAGKTAETGTGLKAMLNELSKSSLTAAKNFKKIAGEGFPDFLKNGGTVTEALKMMAKYAEDNGLQLKDMFRGVESGNAAIILAKDGFADLNEQMEEFGDVSGAVEGGFEEMEQTAMRQWEKMSAAFHDLSITIGAIFMPVINEVLPMLVSAFTGFAETLKTVKTWLEKHGISLKGIVKAVAALTAGLIAYKLVVIAAGARTATMGTIQTLMAIKTRIATAAVRLFNAAVKANPLGLIIGLIATVIAMFEMFGDEGEDSAEQAKEAHKQFMEQMEEDNKAVQKSIESLNNETASWVDKLKNAQANALIKGGDPNLGPKETALMLEERIGEQLDWQRRNNEMNLRIGEKRVAEAHKQEAAQQALITSLGTTDQREKDLVTLTNKRLKEQEKLATSVRDEAKLKFDIWGHEQKITRLTKEAADEEESRLNSIKEILDILKETVRNHDLAKTSMGKVVLFNEKLIKLKNERNKLLKTSLKGDKQQADSADRLKKLNEDILKTEADIGKEIKKRLNEVRKEEIKAIDEKIKKMEISKEFWEDELDAAKELVETKKDELQVQMDLTREKEAALQDALGINNAAVKGAGFQGDKFTIGRNEAGERGMIRRGIGEFKLSTAKIKQEFNRLQEKGALPEGVKNAREFRKHIEAKIRAAKAEVDAAQKAEVAKAKALADAELKQKEMQQNVTNWNDAINAEKKKILKLNEDMLDREKRSLKDITTERIKLEAALAAVRAALQGARKGVDPGVDVAMQKMNLNIQAEIDKILNEKINEAILNPTFTTKKDPLAFDEYGYAQNEAGDWVRQDEHMGRTSAEAAAEGEVHEITVDVPDVIGDEPTSEELRNANQTLGQILTEVKGMTVVNLGEG